MSTLFNSDGEVPYGAWGTETKGLYGLPSIFRATALPFFRKNLTLMPQPVLHWRQTVWSVFSALTSSYSSSGVSCPASARRIRSVAHWRRGARTGPPRTAVHFRKSLRFMPSQRFLFSSLSSPRLRQDVVDPGFRLRIPGKRRGGPRIADLPGDVRRAPVLQVRVLELRLPLRRHLGQHRDLVLLDHLVDQALCIFGIPEVVRPADTGAHAHRDHAVLQPVIAEMALSGIPARGMKLLAGPFPAVLPGGGLLVLLLLGSPLGVEAARVQGPCLVGACFHAGRVVALLTGSWREPSPDVGKRARFLLVDRPVDDARRAFLFGHAARHARLARRAAPKIDEHRPFAVGGCQSSLDIFLDDGQFVPSLHHLLHLLRVALIAAPLHGERRLPVVAGNPRSPPSPPGHGKGLALLLRHVQGGVACRAGKARLLDVRVVAEGDVADFLDLIDDVASADPCVSGRCHGDEERKHDHCPIHDPSSSLDLALPHFVLG